MSEKELTQKQKRFAKGLVECSQGKADLVVSRSVFEALREQGKYGPFDIVFFQGIPVTVSDLLASGEMVTIRKTPIFQYMPKIDFKIKGNEFPHG